jgi:methylmalonyl-CoA mutase
MTDGTDVFASIFPPSTEADWRERVDGILKGGDFTKRLVSRSSDGIALGPLHASRANSPLVAGVAPARPWATAARVDHPDAPEASRLALADLEGGADMLALSFAGGRAARGYGLVAETVDQLDAVLAGVRLDLIRLRLDPAPAGRINALMVAALVERRKLNPRQMRIDFGLDPIQTLLTLGTVPWDWAAMAARLAATARDLAGLGFDGPVLTVDMRPWHEAGATEGQELAAALATGVLYLRALEAHGIPLADALEMISFVMPLDADQLLGLAKLRAFRKLWALVAVSCGVASRPTVVHAETSWRMVAARDTHVNILRASLAASTGGIGGADTLTVLPFTAPLGLADAPARRLARNTSIVLAEEANLWRVTDPSAGSGGIEHATDELAKHAWALFQQVEGEGGMLVSLVLGKLQGRVAAAAAARRAAIATRKMPLTGVSAYPHLAEMAPAVLPVGPVKARVPKPRVRAKVGGSAAEIIAAMVAGASRADVAPVVEGELLAPGLTRQRDAEPWEALRARADAALVRRRRRPAVALVTMGPLSEHGLRLQFMLGLFEAAGMEAKVAAQPEGAFVCLVGSDAGYAQDAAALARKLKAKGRTVWIAGKPGALEGSLRRAGVKRFVAVGDDMVVVLDEALALSGA